VSKLVVHLLLKIRAVSPEAIEHEAIFFKFEHRFRISLHQKELEILAACAVKLL
jgi:hypothetical protein